MAPSPPRLASPLLSAQPSSHLGVGTCLHGRGRACVKRGPVASLHVRAVYVFVFLGWGDYKQTDRVQGAYSR